MKMSKIDASHRTSDHKTAQVNKPARPSGPLSLVRLAVAAVVINTSWLGNAQNFVQSVDSSSLFAAVIKNVGAAETAERAVSSQTTNLDNMARAAAAHLGQANISPETAREERLKILRYQIDAAQIRLEVARSNSILLQTATDFLQSIQAAFPKPNDNLASATPTPGTLSTPGGPQEADLTPTAIALLLEARQYYETAAKLSDDPAMINEAMQGLAKWASKNRQAIILYNDRLRRLQIALASETADEPGSKKHGVDTNSGDCPASSEQRSQMAWFVPPRVSTVIMVYPTRSGSTWPAYPGYYPVYGYEVRQEAVWPGVYTYRYQPGLPVRQVGLPSHLILVPPYVAGAGYRGGRHW